ncbi:hypothetical protein CPB84DRAFT_1884603 [Gymnopilus junonius]|uniref:Uncharacterized protein n=1 Tax=Gymnopilus junonius TaxID=109634 RepID=A0A9P5TFU0_GYMJU|nr:hypothetical protein CPB84DRAFT_1884603 [Gymnopilus junonius]
MPVITHNPLYPIGFWVHQFSMTGQIRNNISLFGYHPYQGVVNRAISKISQHPPVFNLYASSPKALPLTVSQLWPFCGAALLNLFLHPRYITTPWQVVLLSMLYGDLLLNSKSGFLNMRNKYVNEHLWWDNCCELNTGLNLNLNWLHNWRDRFGHLKKAPIVA